MCGIVGIAGQQDPSWLTQMSALVEYRGPDDFGEYRDPEAGVALASRRLSILDLTGGHQPMSNEDGSTWVVHNGEIYNSPQIRSRLVDRGHRFRTSNSDTEVLVHLYEDKQEAMLQELNGMFSFVIYDRARNLLFGARDRLGIKPLYYMQQSDLFAFGSELKCFLPLPSMRREIDPVSLFHYMSLLYIPGEASIFRGVKRVLPGHWFKYDLQTRELTTQRYWDIQFDHVEHRTEAEWCDLIRFELREAVRRRTLSDVPIGCSLSGGIDSSTIVGLLSEIGHSPIKTYSLGFDGPDEEEWNELPLARQVALKWGTEHHELILKPEELLHDLVRMVWQLDEPYGGGLPSWYVFQFMSHDVKVGLTGTGGDELFGNYGKFRPAETSPIARLAMAERSALGLNSRVMESLLKPVGKLAGAMPDRWIGMRRKQRLMDLPSIFRDPLRCYYFDTSYYFSDAVKRDAVFQIQTDQTFDTWAELRGLYEQAMTKDVRNGLAYVDIKTQLPEEFLLMTDRFSMAHSLEARVPFLDHQVVELVFQIPSRIRTRPSNLKYLLKMATGDLLPPEILGARKRGFVVPIKDWLRTQLRPLTEHLLSPERLRSQGIYQPSFYRRYVRPHLEGRADYTWQVWAALMFQLWHLVFVEEAATDTPSFSWRDIY